MADIETARKLDEQYPAYKHEFAIPTLGSLGVESETPEKDSIYFCGNSLGLMPKSTRTAINDELDAWSQRAVESHFRHPGEDLGKTSWVDIDLPVVPLLAPIVGAKEEEVACMGSLTMNLNALLCVFYKPAGKKVKILFEKSAFPSDYYSIYNIIKLSGNDPEKCMIQLSPKEREYTLQTEDIFEAIENNKKELALVLLPGIQYYTGQLFEMEKITQYAKARDITVGWDLAHAVGNVSLDLHDWDVDFAVWCSYKYLNSGPGAIGGIFVHEKHTSASNNSQGYIARLAGWWGNNSGKRFQMLEHFEPIESALGFRQSNPSVIDVVSLQNSLKVFERAGGMSFLREKSIAMTNYLEELLRKSPYYLTPQESFNINGDTKCFTIITGETRGAQLSLLFFPHKDDVELNVMENVNKTLNKKYGIICDERRPDVIRLAPVPLYNTFEECFHVVTMLNKAFENL